MYYHLYSIETMSLTLNFSRKQKLNMRIYFQIPLVKHVIHENKL